MKIDLNKSGIIYQSKDKASYQASLRPVQTNHITLETDRLFINSKNTIQPKEGNHSFLFWLVVPAITIWLTAGYFIGLLKEHPLWFKASSAQETTQVTPYVKKYESIKLTGNGLVTLWFDDAWLSQYMVAYPLIKENGFVGTIAVTTSAIGNKDYLNWAQLRILQENGWQITNHTHLHDCSIKNWGEEDVSKEIKTSTEILWKNKFASDILVTPCGVDSPVLRRQALKNFLGYRTVNPGFNDLNNLDFFELKVKNIDNNTKISEIKDWISFARDSNSWLILVFHKIDETTANTEGADKYNISKQDFVQILDHIKSLDMQVIVPAQLMP